MERADFDVAAYRYRAFISYSREDRDLVDVLYKRLTKWRAPGPLRKRQGKFGPPPRVLDVYMDRKSQQTGEILSSGLRAKLEQSAFLIVVCSRAGADPDSWVTREIEHFLKVASPDRIIPIIVRESPDQPLGEVFPAPLLAMGEDAPIGADLLHDGGIVPVTHKIIGGLTGFSQNEIAREQELTDKRAQRNAQRIAIGVSGLAMVAVISAMVAYQQRQQALETTSKFLGDRLVETIQQKKHTEAMLQALEGLPAARGTIAPSPITAEAEGGLYRALFENRELVRFKPQPLGNIGSTRLKYMHSGASLISSTDMSVQVLDMDTGRKIADITPCDTFQHSTCRIIATFGSKIGSHVAILTHHYISGIDEGNYVIGIWNIQQANEVSRVVDFDSGLIDVRIEAIAFSYDLKKFAAYVRGRSKDTNDSWEQHIKIWDSETGEMLVNIGSFSLDGGLTFTPDGKILATGYDSVDSAGNRRIGIKMWNAVTGAEIEEKLIVLDYSPGRIEFSSSGCQITSVGNVNAYIYQVCGDHSARNQGAVKCSAPDDNYMHAIAFSPIANWLALGSWTGTIHICDISSGEEIFNIESARPVLGLEFSPDGLQLASVDYAGSVHIWDTQQYIPILRVPQAVRRIAISYDGDLIATSGTVKLWNSKSGNEMGNFDNLGSARDVAISADGTHIATAPGGKYADYWKVDSGRKVFTFLHKERVDRVAFSPDGKYLATAGKYNAMIWNLETRAQVFELKGHEQEIYGLKFSRDGYRIVTGSQDGTARIWDVETGRLAQEFAVNSMVFDVEFSPDGRKIATGSSDGDVRIWDVLTGQILVEIDGHGGPVDSVAFSPDGRRLLTSMGSMRLTDDPLVPVARIIDAATGRELIQIQGDREDNVKSVAYFPDGSRIAIGGRRSLKIWPVISESDRSLIALGCGRVQKDSLPDFYRESWKQGLPVGKRKLSARDRNYLPAAEYGPCERSGILRSDFYKSRWCDAIGYGCSDKTGWLERRLSGVSTASAAKQNAQ